MINIDEEINKLLEIKDEVTAINEVKKRCVLNLNVVSPSKYDEIVNNGLIEKDRLYYVVDWDVGQYIEDYIR
jgi:hypothetical protein